MLKESRSINIQSVLLISFISILSVIIHPLQAASQSPDDEASVYQQSTKNPTIGNLREYLKKYPFGVHRQEVEKLLNLRVEAIAWQRAHSEGTRAALTAYLDLYPAGAHAQEAKHMIAALDADADMYEYPNTALNGVVSATVTAGRSACRTMCTGKADCAGYSVTGENTCRLFSSISSAGGSNVSMAATRRPIPSYAVPAAELKNETPRDEKVSDGRDTTTHAPVTECDRQAAAEFDSQKPAEVKGVRFDRIDAIAAIRACEAAVHDYPKEARFQYQLGRAYDKDGSYERARKFFRQALDMNSNAAAVSLGHAYEYGVGIERDYSKAFELYKNAMSEGDCTTCCNLATLYENGFGVTKDEKMAADLYKKSIEANKNLSISYVNLAYMYYDGRGVARDYRKAFDLFMKGVENGGTGSTYYILAALYDAGRGVSYDGDQAAYWYEKALHEGYGFARDLLRDHPDTGTLTFRRALQSRLQQAGAYDGPIDGSFGPRTQKAIDGIFGQY